MEKELNGADRRMRLLDLLNKSTAPLSGRMLGEKTGVSRQIVVQDIALLRAEGHAIVSTARGYFLEEKQVERIIKVFHTNEQIEEELHTIVDLGGSVLEVMVNHRVYGKVTAALTIKSRRDVVKFVENLKTGKSTPLHNITSGYHFHRISAENEEILNEIESVLKEKNFLAEILPYERECFTE